MALVEWSDSFRTGNNVVDRQHQELFRMVNDLHEALINHQGKEMLSSTLDKLAKYVIEHFATEEGFMVMKKYPGLARHKARHLELTKKANEIINQHKNGQMVLTITVSQFLADWVRHHIKEEDQEMTQWLRTNG